MTSWEQIQVAFCAVSVLALIVALLAYYGVH